MLSRSLPRLSNLKALFPPRPHDGWHQPGEIALVGRAYELDAELSAATDVMILQALSPMGSPQEREEPVAAKIGREGFDVDPVCGSNRSCFRLMSTRKRRFRSHQDREGSEHRPHQRNNGMFHDNDVWEGRFAHLRLADPMPAEFRPEPALGNRASMRRSLMNIDCVLPFDFALDSKRFGLWVDQVDLRSVAGRVAEFHASISGRSSRSSKWLGGGCGRRGWSPEAFLANSTVTWR
jgi:hypothetical protein